MEILAIRSVRHDHRILAIVVGPVDVGTQDKAVVHLNRHVPINAHALAYLTAEQAVICIFDVVHDIPLD